MDATFQMTNQWTHLAMVYNTINMVLYVNGVPGAPESMIGKNIFHVHCLRDMNVTSSFRHSAIACETKVKIHSSIFYAHLKLG